MFQFANCNYNLLLAAVLCLVAALLHFACLLFGAPLFRLLGAGNVVVRMAENGHAHPYVMAAVVGVGLSFFAYLCAGLAGLWSPIPLARWMLLLFAMVLLLRALSFPWLKPYFPGNSELFWWLSSTICLTMALLVCLGLWQVWSRV